MEQRLRTTAIVLAGVIAVLLSGCGSLPEASNSSSNTDSAAVISANTPQATPESSPSPEIPDLQAELLDERYSTTTSPIGNFDFKNHTYQLPRGWQNPDGSDITLVDGRVAPVSAELSDKGGELPPSERRIGMSLVTVMYMDATGDGQDEAVVILKIETGGSAIPQIFYVFQWKDNAPEPIWVVRTGDRSDGGLKDIRIDTGDLIVELYGQDRFILGQIETGKITGDEVQLCCPTHFTRTRYQWNGKNFLMRGKRLTFEVANPSAPPVENMGDIVNAANKK